MMRVLKSALVLAMFALLQAPAWSADRKASFGGMDLVLSDPSGFCWIRDEHPVDTRVFEYVSAVQRGSGNKLVAYWGDCESLRALRNGTNKGGLVRWIIVSGKLSRDGRELTYPRVSRSAFLRQMTRQISKDDFDQIVKQGHSRMEARIADVNRKYLGNPDALTVGKPQNLGILEVSNAIYFGMLMQLNPPEGARFIAAIGSMGLTKGVILYAYHYGDYRDKQTIPRLLAASKAYRADLEKRNR